MASILVGEREGVFSRAIDHMWHNLEEAVEGDAADTDGHPTGPVTLRAEIRQRDCDQNLDHIVPNGYQAWKQTTLYLILLRVLLVVVFLNIQLKINRRVK